MDNMIVKDLSEVEVKRLIERYDFQIRNALRIIKQQPNMNVEARVALNAANSAKKKKELLMRMAS